MSGNYTGIPGYGGNNWQNPVASALDLPSIDNTQGDMRVTLDSGILYIWEGAVWVSQSGSGPSADVNIAAVGGSPFTLGQGTMAHSLPVVIASDQSPINVVVTNEFATQTVRVLYNEVTTISVGSETTINTYTAPTGKVAYLLTVLGNGENTAIYNIYNNGVLFDKQYSSLTQFAVEFDYKTGASSVPGFIIPVGNVLVVTTINSGNSSANFNSRLLILEVS